ncbi:MAG: hypothetical protein M3Z50_03920 [Actinomycetota bacterium]|nr:hypothetical protein [Actinomycetota bacterium]
MFASAGCTQSETITPPAPQRDTSDTEAAGSQHLLDQLTAALRAGDRSRVLALAAAGSAGQLSAIADNYRRLGIGGLSMRYVADNTGGLSDAERQHFGPSAWAASVEVSYRISRYDTGPTTMEAGFVFARDRQHGAKGVRLAAVGGQGDRSPLWLLDPLAVRRTARTLVLVAPGNDVAEYAALAARAVRDVNRVLRGWRGDLVVEVPGSQAELDAILGTDRQRYANIAAVTTSVDGSLGPGSPVHVFVNPAIFDTLRHRGAQVVMSHETTHVATRAAFASMPTWLVEGFADFVALDHAGVPVQVAARQYLAKIRKHGLPTHLPTATDLSPTAPGLGATYEAAWLACRYLGKRYGEANMVAFYRAVDRGSSADQAFVSVLGTTSAAFLRGWRADLGSLALGGVGG